MRRVKDAKDEGSVRSEVVRVYRCMRDLHEYANMVLTIPQLTP